MGYALSPFYNIAKTKYKIEHQMTANGNGNKLLNKNRCIIKLFNELVSIN